MMQYIRGLKRIVLFPFLSALCKLFKIANLILLKLYITIVNNCLIVTEDLTMLK